MLVQRQQPPRALGQDLERMLGRLGHHAKDSLDIVERHVLVKEIAHRVDEHAAGLCPPERLFQLMRHQTQIEALLEGMARHATEALSKGLGVAVLAARADLGAAA